MSDNKEYTNTNDNIDNEIKKLEALNGNSEI